MDKKKLEIKTPMSREEYEELLDSFNEISEDDLDAVVGGNDDLKTKFAEPVDATCPFCGATVRCKMAQDMAKHIAQACPNNPYA